MIREVWVIMAKRVLIACVYKHGTNVYSNGSFSCGGTTFKEKRQRSWCFFIKTSGHGCLESYGVKQMHFQ